MRTAIGVFWSSQDPCISACQYVDGSGVVFQLLPGRGDKKTVENFSEMLSLKAGSKEGWEWNLVRSIWSAPKGLRCIFFRLFLVLSGVFLISPSVLATPALLVDMVTGEVLQARDAGQPWHPASLTKLTTAIVTFQAIDNGAINLDTPVIISAAARRAPPSKSGLPVDTAITMRDALNLLIVKSANDVAIAIAETVSGSVEKFVDEMNQMAATLGMSATNFTNPHGLHDRAQVTSARDMALLGLSIRRHFPQYASLFATSVVKLSGNDLRTHNNLLTEFAGTTGMKTGFICSAGLNMVATVERNGRKLLAVVLGASSARERGELAAKMFSDYLNGQRAGTGMLVQNIVNTTDAPVDMRANICGAGAREYVAARETAFPYGLAGQPSFLTAEVADRVYRVRPLGRLRDVPVPRPRPANAPLLRGGSKLELVETVAATAVPLPLPRSRP